MALKSVGARTEGDIYQGLFFWYQAAVLLQPKSPIQRVEIEHDAASGVDDVAVFYNEPGVDAGGGSRCRADYFQVKYHVDRRDAYSARALIDPDFIQAKSSLLQRVHSAYLKLAEPPDVRLYLISNWTWTRQDDELAKRIREADGALPREFFTQTYRGRLGEIREEWRAHLGLNTNAFERFARTLRLQLDHFGRRNFQQAVHDRLARYGLKVPTPEQTVCPYSALVQRFLTDGPNSFNRETLLALCRFEDLLISEDAPVRAPAIGVRSYIRAAERLEDEVDAYVCVADEFEGRYARMATSWPMAATRVAEFLRSPDVVSRCRGVEHSLMLECHGSLAILAGYELSNNTGCQVFPVQKPFLQVWKPSEASQAASWQPSVIDRDSEASDIAIALSVTRDISSAVLSYLDREAAPRVREIMSIQPDTGVGINSVRDADHAWSLADSLVALFRKHLTVPGGRVHLFACAPNALLYFIGRHREALGKVALYEYDFGQLTHCTYEPSIMLPFQGP